MYFKLAVTVSIEVSLCISVIYVFVFVSGICKSRNCAKDRKPEDPNRRYLMPAVDSVEGLLNGTHAHTSLTASQNWQTYSKK